MLILKGHTQVVRCLAYSPDSALLASGGEDGSVLLWDLSSPGSCQSLQQLDWSVEALAWSPDGQVLLVGDSAGKLTRWSWPGRREEQTINAHLRAGVRAIHYSRDGKTLATVGWDQKVRLWEADTLDAVAVRRGTRSRRQRAALGGTPRKGFLACAAFLPDNKTLVAGGPDGVLRFFKVSTGQQQHELRDEGPLAALSCSPDGRLLAAGANDGDVTLWNLGKGEIQATLRGHTWTTNSLAFTPDGHSLLSGSADGTIRVWDVLLEQERHVYRWHDGWVSSLAVAPDGMTAASGSADKTIVLWDLD